MADYRLRIHRRHPNKEIIQVVVYLTPSGSPLVTQTIYEFPGHRSEYRVIRMWEQPTRLFLSAPGLYPFAALSQVQDREQVLRQVGQRAAQLQDRSERAHVTASAGILAALLLRKDTIRQILREDIMRESPLVQDWLAEGQAEGRIEERTEIALKMLREGLDPQMITRITGLSPDQIWQLQEQVSDE